LNNQQIKLLEKGESNTEAVPNSLREFKQFSSILLPIISIYYSF